MKNLCGILLTKPKPSGLVGGMTETCMNFVIKLATPSGDKVLGRCNHRQVRFHELAHKLGYAAAQVRDEARQGAAYMMRCMESESPLERAIESVNLMCGIRVEKA